VYTAADGPGTAAPSLADIPAILGGQYAFVGIVGATGGENAEIEVSNFKYNGRVLLPQPAAASANLTDIYVKSSAWTTAFTTYLESKGLGDDVYGYKVLGNGAPVAGPAGNTDNVLPWINMDQVVLKYSGTPTTGIPTPGTNWLTTRRASPTPSPP
jgi:hypothetical protein